jgi:hypothetical protein
MAYFDTEKRSLLIVDASPLRICAILAQREKSGVSYRIISYASRALCPVESRYSQPDIEGLSLVWGIEHFRLFLLGTEFDVYTDTKLWKQSSIIQDQNPQLVLNAGCYDCNQGAYIMGSETDIGALIDV